METPHGGTPKGKDSIPTSQPAVTPFALTDQVVS